MTSQYPKGTFRAAMEISNAIVKELQDSCFVILLINHVIDQQWHLFYMM